MVRTGAAAISKDGLRFPKIQVKVMLSEQTIADRWNQLFKDGHITSETIRAAEEMIDQLPPESPLRLRLDNQLSELRNMAASRNDASDERPKV
jgi:hypothetical protein